MWCILDRIYGNGLHHTESFIHFHPDVELEACDNHFIARANGQTLTVLPFSQQETRHYRGNKDFLQGWYSPEFGVKVSGSVLGFKKSGLSPLLFGYLLIGGAIKNWAFDYECQAAKEIYQIRLDDRQYRVIVDLELAHIHLVLG
jgi:hypothetical protein